jgi:hypothetical protein
MNLAPELLVACSSVGNVYLVILFLMATYGVIANTVTSVAAIFGSGLVLGAVIKTAAYAFLARKTVAI